MEAVVSTKGYEYQFDILQRQLRALVPGHAVVPLYGEKRHCFSAMNWSPTRASGVWFSVPTTSYAARRLLQSSA